MRIQFEKFRSFAETPMLAIRPITLLVGENSSGKSSYLAGLSIIYRMISDELMLSFNQEPFPLGSYEDIVHRSPRREDRRYFRFVVTDCLSALGAVRDALTSPLKQSVPKMDGEDFLLDVKFSSHRARPLLSHVNFSCGPYGFTVDLEGQPTCRVRFPESAEESFDVSEYANLIRQAGLSNLGIYIRVGTMRDDQKVSNLYNNLRNVVYLYDGAIRTLRRNHVAIAPVRSRPLRVYNGALDNTPVSSGDHVPAVLAEMKTFNADRWDSIRRAIRWTGQASGMFEDVDVKLLSRTPGSPFQIMVKRNGVTSNLADVGYGVSQLLPLLIEPFRAPEGTVFLLQQPEVHLHPRAQSELATFFVDVCRELGLHFVIETHSDYLIDRLRMLVRDKKIKSEDVAILYFEKTGRESEVWSISIDDLGNIVGQPDSYRQFFLEESLKSMSAP